MYFVYKNKSSKDYGIKILKSNHLSKPGRKVDIEPIPGRNGDLIIDYGNYENFKFNLEIDFDISKTKFSTIEELADEISRWLQGPVTYSDLKLYRNNKLIKTYQAAFVSKLDIIEAFIQCGEARLVFECKPPMEVNK